MAFKRVIAGAGAPRFVGHEIRFGVGQAKNSPYGHFVLKLASGVARSLGFVKGPDGRGPKVAVFIGEGSDEGKVQVALAAPSDQGTVQANVDKHGTVTIGSVRVPVKNVKLRMTNVEGAQLDTRHSMVVFDLPEQVRLAARARHAA